MPAILVRGEPFLLKEERERRVKLVAEHRDAAAASPMKAYFFIAPRRATCGNSRTQAANRPVCSRRIPDDLSLKYRMLACSRPIQATPRAISLAAKPASAKCTLLMGQRAVLNGDLAVRLSRADPCARAVARQRVDCARARKRHVFLRALCAMRWRCSIAFLQARPHRCRAAGPARPREIAELSEAPRRGHCAADRAAAERSEQQSRREVLLARVEPAAARPRAARLRRCDRRAERDAKRRDLPACGHGVVQPESPRRIARLFRRGARR